MDKSDPTAVCWLHVTRLCHRIVHYLDCANISHLFYTYLDCANISHLFYTYLDCANISHRPIEDPRGADFGRLIKSRLQQMEPFS